MQRGIYTQFYRDLNLVGLEKTIQLVRMTGKQGKSRKELNKMAADLLGVVTDHIRWPRCWVTFVVRLWL